MDIVLSEAQEMLKRSARELLQTECSVNIVRNMENDENGFPVQLWDRISRLGWNALPFPESYGGSSGSFFDLALLVEELGYSAAPVPFISSTVLGGFLIMEAGSIEQKAELLPKIASGETLLSLAYLDGDGGAEEVGVGNPVEPKLDGFLLSGVKKFVSDAHLANYILWVDRTKNGRSPTRGLSLFLIDSKDSAISMNRMASVGGDKLFQVQVTDKFVRTSDAVGRIHHAGSSLQKVLLRATALKCAEMVGGAQAVLDMTIEYVKGRVQFGRPIGSFQAVHHHCADMYRELQMGRLLAYQACWLLENSMPSDSAVYAAKLKLNHAYPLITRLAHQVTGAVGYYTEYPLELYTRRALAASVSFGGVDYHAKSLSKVLW